MDSTYIVIPAFNEAKVLEDVILDVKSSGYDKIILVDDGSSDDTYYIARSLGCITLRHIINRGKGAATQTGLEAAKRLNADYAITIDADGQHSPSQISSILQPLTGDKYDVVLGSRMLKVNSMPIGRKVVNKIGNVLTLIFYGIYVSDSQSGFRGYNKKAINLIETTFDRYEFESEIIHQIKLHNLKYKEVPISVKYTDHSLNKWKDVSGIPSQSIANGFRMLMRMVIRSITT